MLWPLKKRIVTVGKDHGDLAKLANEAGCNPAIRPFESGSLLQYIWVDSKDGLCTGLKNRLSPIVTESTHHIPLQLSGIRATGFYPVCREFKSLKGYQRGASLPQRIIAKMTMGMGPIGSELGGHQIAVEVARNHYIRPLRSMDRIQDYES